MVHGRNFLPLEDDGFIDESHSLSTLLSVDQLRVLELERIFPTMKFLRDDGEIRGWGFVPEQAFGTIDGNPFYYRFRGNGGSITVWDGKRISLEQILDENVSYYNIDPLLYSSVSNWTPGDDYAGDTEGIDCIKYLIENLAKLDESELYGNQRGENAVDNGFWRTRDFQKSMERWDHGFKIVERNDSFMNADEIYLRCNDGTALQIGWRWWVRYGQGGLSLSVVAPSDDPVLDSKVANAFIRFDTSVSVDEAVDKLFETVGDVQWDYLHPFKVVDKNKMWLFNMMSGIEGDYDGEDFHAFVAQNQPFVKNVVETFKNAVKA